MFPLALSVPSLSTDWHTDGQSLSLGKGLWVDVEGRLESQQRLNNMIQFIIVATIIRNPGERYTQ